MIVFILCLDISIFVVIWWSYIILCSCDYSLFVYPWVNITLHSTRSLFCTATNTTSLEKLFNFTRKSTGKSGKSIPSRIKPGLIFLSAI